MSKGGDNDDFFGTAAGGEPTTSGYNAEGSAEENADLDEGEGGEGGAGANSVRVRSKCFG